ncbi:MAG: Dipeptide transport system ATP-binding protein [Firmicutes bacterium]|nr:Dipeptide transport system ATP-binding protein [Bacillota bacterium]
MSQLLKISDLRLQFKTFEGVSQVLNGVDLELHRGDIMGLVGETGCGKSLTALSVSRLVATPPGEYTAGSVLFDGEEILAKSEAEMQQLRGRRIAMIFQDPTTNLNPVFTIEAQMVDVILAQGELKGWGARAAARERAVELLTKVGITDARKRIKSYPHEFSGGMKQRVLIAMALAGSPDLLIADKPTTALDVSIQAQILQLIKNLVREMNLTVLLVTHNLGVVAQVCNKVTVMYAGNVVETGPVREIFKRPQHPYTKGLLASVPTVGQELKGIPGSIPNLVTPPSGCRFHPRCPLATAICQTVFPPMAEDGTEHRVYCYHPLGVAE